MAKSTPATLALEKAGVAFKLHEYDYDPSAARIGMQAAEALGIEPARLLQTLMANAGNDVITGYHVGGISAFGQKKRARVFIEQSAMLFPLIVANGGRRGLQVELSPADLARVLDATAAEIC